MLTVLLATHNGTDTLGRTLDAFCQVDQPEGGWKLLLVNNASRDNTEAVVFGYRGRLPIEYIKEPRLGKCFALNTGIPRVSGDLVVFVDDDVLPSRDFLVQWRQVADDLPDFSVFGGQIVPQFEIPPPKWLRQIDWIMLLYGATRPGHSAGEPPDVPSADIFGGNMAIRTSVLASGFSFDERLMVGRSSLMSDETELVGRLAECGFRLWFAPGPQVRHLIDAEHVRWFWIMHRFFRHGRTLYFIAAQRQPIEAQRLFGVPRYLIRRISARAVRVLRALVACDQETAVALERLIAYDLGTAYQARRMAHGFGSASGGRRTEPNTPDRPTLNFVADERRERRSGSCLTDANALPVKDSPV